MTRRMLLAALLVAAAVAGPASATTQDEAVKSVIAKWYAELLKRSDAHLSPLLAPGGMVEPDYRCPDDDQPQPRALDWTLPPYPHFLAMRAGKFAYEVERMQVERTLAKVDVWERGWIYAGAAKRTYENAADATFILERKENEGWKVLLYASHSQAVRHDHRNQPMPDLSPKGESDGGPQR